MGKCSKSIPPAQHKAPDPPPPQNSVNSLKVNLGYDIKACSECSKHSKAIEIAEMFDWGPSGLIKAIGFDKETNEIVLLEEWIMYAIQLMNPMQQPRKMRLVSREEWYNRKKTKE